MDTKVSFLKKHPIAQDILSLTSFIICVILGVVILNTFIFRSYNVVGVSMENTLHGDDRVIVNRIPVTLAHLQEKEYIPNRGDVIVFVNGPASGPLTCDVESGVRDQYIIKRVIAFPGERVRVKDGRLTVYNDANPEGFDPDLENRKNNEGPKEYTSGEVDMKVPEGEVFVSGDNREGSHSYDSRNGLGTIPFCRIVGPASLRFWPLNKIEVL